MPPQHEQQLSVIDGLTARPFPDEQGRPGASGRWSGPGFHLAVLRESQDFWEDRSTEVVEAAEEDLEADCAALSAVLTERWGAPETVDLWPYLDADRTREPLGFLCGVAADMRMWRLPGGQRWLALTVGQADPEWQFQLLAAVGETSALG
jgi:hypothetical protein